MPVALSLVAPSDASQLRVCMRATHRVTMPRTYSFIRAAFSCLANSRNAAAISDDDDSVSSENDIPSKVEKESAKKVVEEEEDEEDEEDEDDEEEYGAPASPKLGNWLTWCRYVVDKIISHLTDDDVSALQPIAPLPALTPL